MSQEHENATTDRGSRRHEMLFEARVGLAGKLSTEHEHRAVLWNLKAAVVLVFLLAVPPPVTWLLAMLFPPLGGFLGVVVGWIVGVVATIVGYRAVVEHVTIQPRPAPE
jgi:amino acid permease